MASSTQNNATPSKGSKRLNLLKDIAGGKILTNHRIIKQWSFMLYIFIIMLVYISINLGMEGTQITLRKNQRELKNLKANYSSAAAKLQYMSKSDEVESELIEKGSKLRKPKRPAIYIENK